MNAGDEVLCDVDHQSCRPGVEKDTSAAGWFTKFVVDPIKGLFASLKLTKRGKELLENREYRYTSPTFMLNENGEPVDMHSVSLTNTPAFKGFINPVINSEATPIDDVNESITNMNKEELISLIKETVIAMNSCSDKKEDEVKNDVPEQVVADIEKAVEAAEEVAEKAKTEEPEKTETVEAPVEEVKNDVVEAPVEEPKVEEKEEVIKIETLNSAPIIGVDITGKTDWQNLKGKAFFQYLKDHPEVYNR